MKTKLTRRHVLTGAALAAAAGATDRFSGAALASVTVGPSPARSKRDVIVVLFLRGGADGLNIVVPYGDSDYHKLRPTLGVAAPNDRGESPAARAIDLNGFFGLHPAMAPLLPLYRDGALAAVHAIGSDDQTRSHFEAMATMERGLARDTGTASGWLARHLTSTATDADPPLRAVAVTDTMPDSLRGATVATCLSSLSDFRLVAPTGANGSIHHSFDRSPAIVASLRDLYAGGAPHGDSSLGRAGLETLDAVEAVRRLDPEHYRPAPGARYPSNDLAAAFRQVACLVKGHIGLEVACIDMTGWDTHVAQGRDTGWQPSHLGDLSRSLAAFAADLGPEIANVTTIVMTEFGRRAYENSGFGTDHGRASCMLVLGGSVAGGKVYARWPGLADSQLDGPGDLKVTTDYRDVLAEVLEKRAGNRRVNEVFLGGPRSYLGIIKSAVAA